MSLSQEFSLGTLGGEIPEIPEDYEHRFFARAIQESLELPPTTAPEIEGAPTTADGYADPGRGPNGESSN
jgi:hypothetical protein